jgi:hypothetical protein
LTSSFLLFYFFFFFFISFYFGGRQNLVLGGSDTTTITLTWALSLLLDHSDTHTLKKAYEELDKVVGRDRHVDESDIKNLVYLQAIFSLEKETLRLYPPSPFVIRSLLEDCTLSGGYHIPANTRNPADFQPERFFTSHKHVEVRGQSFELIPFGSVWQE